VAGERPAQAGSERQCFVVLPDTSLVADALRIVGEDAYVSRQRPNTLITEVSDQARLELERMGAQIFPAHRYEAMPEPIDLLFSPLAFHPKNLNDVLAHIHAGEAWKISRGEGVHIAVVDTGICGTLPEFPQWKQAAAAFNWSYSGSAWVDTVGHGSMAAGVAAANRGSHGRYNGVAPDAVLISCKTQFYDTELFQIYDHLIQLVDEGAIERLVINNSYGWYRCQPTNIQRSDPFPAIIIDAAARGILSVFAAGNNHVLKCGNAGGQCRPNSIWAVNSLDEVMAVGTVDQNNRMDQPCQNPAAFCHRDSSRGPGELSVERPKPDCVAPTYGEVIWGCGYQIFEWWGTSGAAPQVSGLAALLLSRAPHLKPDAIADIVCNTCTRLPLAPECAGAGLINCLAAVTHPQVQRVSSGAV
jgi:serine protease AprX